MQLTAPSPHPFSIKNRAKQLFPTTHIASLNLRTFPKPLTFKLQQEVLKYNDSYISWSSTKTDLEINFLSLDKKEIVALKEFILEKFNGRPEEPTAGSRKFALVWILERGDSLPKSIKLR